MQNLASTQPRESTTSSVRHACRACHKTYATTHALYKHERKVHGISHTNEGKEYYFKIALLNHKQNLLNLRATFYVVSEISVFEIKKKH